MVTEADLGLLQHPDGTLSDNSSRLEAYYLKALHLGCCSSPRSVSGLDSTTSIDSNNLFLKGYNLHHVDDPDNVNKEGICVYYKETLVAQFLQTKLDQCIVSEVTFNYKKKVLLLYEELLQDIFKLKSSFILITGGFNCRNSNWYLREPVAPQGACVEALNLFMA